MGPSFACPFCPGNEHLTAPLVTADPGPDWPSRVVANLYPSVVEPDGRHEVIIELRAHDARWTALSSHELARVLEVYRQREAARFAEGFAFVTIFKNSGSAAGASLAHPHAQLIALRAVPESIAVRLARLTAPCRVCAAGEPAAAGRVVLRTAHAVAYVPDGSRTAFEVRIAPVEHRARFADSAALVPDIATALAGVMKRLAATLGEDVPFNLIVQSAPRDPRAETRMHWEIEVVPRIENLGGFEVGTGSFLVSRLPEDAAAILRAAALEAPLA
jgi:UDPglucose--hexose-1-phosphate uridylyltransferase